MRDDKFYLIYILESIKELEGYVEGGKAEFEKSHLIQDASARKLHVITESTQRLSDKIKNSHAEVNWRRISGFRNVMVHDYLGLELNEVWKVIKIDIPQLKKTIENLLNEV
ncbi:MAG: DUF86 domain-containing protein [Candidatus Eremiobacteraeota bacterium]|nr:DUF86 domain-containing protein [Candidatus Eremiobacteraeota bacterium]